MPKNLNKSVTLLVSIIFAVFVGTCQNTENKIIAVRDADEKGQCYSKCTIHVFDSDSMILSSQTDSSGMIEVDSEILRRRNKYIIRAIPNSTQNTKQYHCLSGTSQFTWIEIMNIDTIYIAVKKGYY
jgi:hypothetical protein